MRLLSHIGRRIARFLSAPRDAALRTATSGREKLAATLRKGDVPLVERHLAANPDSIRTSVNETWFPKRDPRAGGHIYIWTLGADRTPHTVAREFGHDAVFRLLMERSPAALRLAVACELGDEATVAALRLARAYDEGAGQLYEFFEKQLRKFDESDLDPLGRKIIDCCISRGKVEDYELLLGCAPEALARLADGLGALGTPLTAIGEIVPGEDVEFRDAAGRRVPVAAGFEHFVTGQGR